MLRTATYGDVHLRKQAGTHFSLDSLLLTLYKPPHRFRRAPASSRPILDLQSIEANSGPGPRSTNPWTQPIGGPLPSSRSRILVVSLVFFVFGLTNSVKAQITTDAGIPVHTIQIPVPMGFVSATTGKLHLEIPLRSTPQRNRDSILEKWVYDPAIGGWFAHIGNSHSGTGSFQSSSQNCTSAGYPGYPNGSVNTNFGWYFQDDHYTSHAVVNQYVSTKQVNCFTNSSPPVYFGSGSDITSTSGVAADGSGYSFSVSNYTQMHVYAPDGTLVYDNSGDQQTAEYPVDTNGNFAAYASSTSNSGSQPDTSASGFVYGPSGCGTTYPCTRTRSFNDSSGTLRSYSLTWAQFQTAVLNNGVQTTHTGTFVTSISLQDGNQYNFTYDTGSVGNHNGAILTMTLPTGGVVSFTYVPHVGSVFDWDWISSITYAGGTWNLGYSQNTSNYQLTTTLTAPPRYDFASKTNVSDTTVFTTVPYGNLYPFLQTAQFKSGSSTLLRSITVGYDGNGNYVPLTVATTLNDTGQSSTASYQYFSSNLMRNYPTQVQETDFTGTVVRTTKTAYNGFMKPTSVNVYAGTGTGSPIASTLYTYDEYSASYCKNNILMLSGFTGAHGHDDAYGTSDHSRGNVTTIQRLISGTTYSTTHNCYDTLGNVTQTVDANGNPTSFDYTDNWNDSDCIPSGTITHAFPTTLTNALGYRSKTSYYSCGILKQSAKDENDIRATRGGATFTYDLFNRGLTATDSAGGSTTNSYSVSVPPSVTTSKAITNSVSLNSTALQDTYGRVYQTQLTSDPDGITYRAKTFDALGHDSQTYNPTRCNPPTSNCGEATWGSSTTTYDALGRITSVTTAPDGQVTTTTYSGTCSTTTDPAGKARKVCSDALGRLTQAFEDPAGLNYETDYTYDLLNNLLTVNQKGGSTNSALWRTRTFTYDSLSRLVCASNPENSSAACPATATGTYTIGTTGYAYDANGNLTSKTSPAPNQTGTSTVTTTYQYDALNRLTQKSYSDGVTLPALFGYDQTLITMGSQQFNISNSIGRMSWNCILHTNSCGGSMTANSYDPVGRLAELWQENPVNSNNIFGNCLARRDS
jgi:YD repeat-containing protein